MSNARHETTTYRGGTLDEVLPRIRDELGPEAVILRQREGIVGGFGGFFGKRCVEIEARAAAVRQSEPSRTVIGAYDAGEPPEGESSALLQTLLDQSSPFAVELSSALAVEPADAGAQVTPVAPVAAPVPGWVEELADEAAEELPDELPEERATEPEAPIPDDPATVRADLVAAGFSAAVADGILAEALRTLRPFAPGVPLAVLARRALIRRIRVDAGWEKKRRTIALIGTAGTGRTLTAAKLCNAFAGAGRKVTALSLEPARRALELGALTDGGSIALEIASTPGSLRRAPLREADVVVVDTPPLDASNPASFAPTARLLGELRSHETHLLLRTDADYEAGRALIMVLSGPLKPSRILVTGADRGGQACAPVALSLALGIPISFVADGPHETGGVHPAEADELAHLALP